MSILPHKMQASFQITEKEFSELYDNMYPASDCVSYNTSLNRLKQAGYIKKSIYDEAIEAYRKLSDSYAMKHTSMSSDWVMEQVNKIYTALNEARNKQCEC